MAGRTDQGGKTDKCCATCIAFVEAEGDREGTCYYPPGGQLSMFTSKTDCCDEYLLRGQEEEKEDKRTRLDPLVARAILWWPFA
jgi:hypothetical protein